MVGESSQPGDVVGELETWDGSVRSGVPQKGQYASLTLTMRWHCGQLGASLWLQRGQKLNPASTALPHWGQAWTSGRLSTK